MDNRTTIRRSRAIIRQYHDAYITALLAYYATEHGTDWTDECQRALDVESALADAAEQTAHALATWAKPTANRGATVVERLRAHGDSYLDTSKKHHDRRRGQWLLIVADDVEARLADPSGTRKRPLPTVPTKGGA